MKRNSNGKEINSITPVIQMVSIMTLCLIDLIWSIANCFTENLYIHRINDLIVISLSTVLIWSLLIISIKEMTTDPLTKANNKESITFHAVMLFILKKLHNYTSFFVNLRDFKYINRMYGARYGDIVLRKYVAELRNFLGKGSFVSRLGGDNFLLLVKNEKAAALQDFIERVNVSVQVKGNPVLIPVYGRCGVYALKEEDNVSDAFNRPSTALNVLKKKSSGYYLYYDEKFSENLFKEQTIFSTYKDAMSKDEFVVYFQPKVNIQQGNLCGAEALV